MTLNEMAPRTLEAVSYNIHQNDEGEQFSPLLVCHIWPKTYLKPIFHNHLITTVRHSRIHLIIENQNNHLLYIDCTFQTLWRVSMSSCVWCNSVNVMSEVRIKISRNEWASSTGVTGQEWQHLSLTVLLGILVYSTNLVWWDWLKTHDKPWGCLLFSVFLVSCCSCGNLLMGCIWDRKETVLDALSLHLHRKSE